ncbi:unnamed protein product, partial [Mesorhabditis spiculigera]
MSRKHHVRFTKTKSKSKSKSPMEEKPPKMTERLHGQVTTKAIVYGNTAEAFGYKRYLFDFEADLNPRETDGHTHAWTVFVKPYENEDMSVYVRKVQFKLHESYENAVRTIDHPPFEVTETGWGEFEVQIRIYFVDQNEKPVTAFHYLRLFQPVFNAGAGRSVVAAEFYDELVFKDPTPMMQRALTSTSAKKERSRRFYNDFEDKKQRIVENVEQAKQEIGKEIEDLRDALRDAYKLIVQHRDEIEGGDSGPVTPNPN